MLFLTFNDRRGGLGDGFFVIVVITPCEGSFPKRRRVHRMATDLISHSLRVTGTWELRYREGAPLPFVAIV